MIAMTYRGLRHGPPEVIERLERGEAVDPAGYYFRIAAAVRDRGRPLRLAQPHPRHRLGHRQADGPVYSLFEL